MLNMPVGIRTPRRKAAACCAVLFGLACHVPGARAALTEADASSGTQTTYDSNILANDIIQNGSGALAGADDERLGRQLSGTSRLITVGAI